MILAGSKLMQTMSELRDLPCRARLVCPSGNARRVPLVRTSDQKPDRPPSSRRHSPRSGGTGTTRFPPNAPTAKVLVEVPGTPGCGHRQLPLQLVAGADRPAGVAGRLSPVRGGGSERTRRRRLRLPAALFATSAEGNFVGGNEPRRLLETKG